MAFPACMLLCQRPQRSVCTAFLVPRLGGLPRQAEIGAVWGEFLWSTECGVALPRAVAPGRELAGSEPAREQPFLIPGSYALATDS